MPPTLVSISRYDLPTITELDTTRDLAAELRAWWADEHMQRITKLLLKGEDK